jgi:predicted HD superfamily hydrolase involved in NAD metabolism
LVKTQARLNEEILKDWLRNRLSDERYHHSIGAQQKAIELARNFRFSQEDIQKAGLAGLLHDAAKLMSPAELLAACQEMSISCTEHERRSPQTLHPFVGAELVSREFGVEDEDVLNAIRYHTTGRAGMSPVEKLVYIADKIEGNTRNPLYTQKITALFNFQERTTLDRAALYILDSTITFLIEKGQLIHPRTIEARNDLVEILHPKKPRSSSS